MFVIVNIKLLFIYEMNLTSMIADKPYNIH